MMPKLHIQTQPMLQSLHKLHEKNKPSFSFEAFLYALRSSESYLAGGAAPSARGGYLDAAFKGDESGVPAALAPPSSARI